MTPLVSLAYAPPVAWFALLWPCDTAMLETQENYQKGSLRNRCYIAGPNGLQRLSIPLLKGKNQQQALRDVRLAAGEPWQRQHWRSLRTAYGNAPYWQHYADALAPFYERKFTFLIDFNLELLAWLGDKLRFPCRLQPSETYAPKPAGPPAADYRDALPEEPGQIPPWFAPSPYPQVFQEKHGFLGNLSAFDLLFCTGNRAGEFVGASRVRLV